MKIDKETLKDLLGQVEFLYWKLSQEDLMYVMKAIDVVYEKCEEMAEDET